MAPLESLMSVPRPAVLVATVTDSVWPALWRTYVSSSLCISLSKRCGISCLVNKSENSIESLMVRTRISTGRLASLISMVLLTIAKRFCSPVGSICVGKRFLGFANKANQELEKCEIFLFWALQAYFEDEKQQMSSSQDLQSDLLTKKIYFSSLPVLLKVFLNVLVGICSPHQASVDMGGGVAHQKNPTGTPSESLLALPVHLRCQWCRK